LGNGRRSHKKHWVNQSFKSKAAFQVQYEDAKAKARMAFEKVKRELEERAAGGEIITVGWQGQGQLSCVMDATINGLKKAIDEEHHHQLVLLTKFEAKWLAILLFLASVVAFGSNAGRRTAHGVRDSSTHTTRGITTRQVRLQKGCMPTSWASTLRRTIMKLQRFGNEFFMANPKKGACNLFE
jgi:hypothetical protein